MAGLIAAGLEGIESKLEPPEPIMGDAYTPVRTHTLQTKGPTSYGSPVCPVRADLTTCAVLSVE